MRHVRLGLFRLRFEPYPLESVPAGEERQRDQLRTSLALAFRTAAAQGDVRERVDRNAIDGRVC